MSKALGTINIHTLIRKLLQTKIPGTLIKLLKNCTKGRRVYTTYINYISSQRQFKTGVPQGGVLSPTLFNIYTADIPSPSALVQVMAYTDDMTITSTHTSTTATKKYIQPCIHIVFVWTNIKSRQNNLNFIHSRPCRIQVQSELTINNTIIHMTTHPWVMGLTLHQNLTYITTIHNISVYTHKPLQIVKSLNATAWEKQKETLRATYKVVMRPALAYSSSTWSPLALSTNINKQQAMQNAALRTAI